MMIDLVEKTKQHVRDAVARYALDSEDIDYGVSHQVFTDYYEGLDPDESNEVLGTVVVIRIKSRRPDHYLHSVFTLGGPDPHPSVLDPQILRTIEDLRKVRDRPQE